MTAPERKQVWYARPSKVTQRLVYAGLGLLGLAAAIVMWEVAEYHHDASTMYLIVGVTAAALLSWLGGRLLIWALRRAGVFGVVQASGDRLTVGRRGLVFDLSNPVKVDPRSSYTRTERDTSKQIGAWRSRGYGWVWNASVQVTQEGQWATLTADGVEGAARRKSKEVEQDPADSWADLKTRDREPSPPRGTTLRLASGDLARVLRTLQAGARCRIMQLDEERGAPQPRRQLIGLKTAVGVAIELAVSFAIVAVVDLHYTALSRAAARQKRLEYEKAHAPFAALWKSRIGRWVKVKCLEGATVYGRITDASLIVGSGVNLTIALEVVEDSDGDPNARVYVGGCRAKRGDTAFVGASDVALEEPPPELLIRPPGGLSRKGWAKLQEILGDKMGQTLTAEEQKEMVERFRQAGVSISDVVSAKELLSKPLPKPETPAKKE